MTTLPPPPAVLYDVNDIDQAVTQLARDIEDHIARRRGGHRPIDVHLVVVLDGAFIFAADLARAFQCYAHVHFVGVRSYETMQPKTNWSWTKRLDLPALTAKYCVVVDDIVETGRTMDLVRKEVESAHPASVDTCALLFKEDCGGQPPDYVGFRCRKDEFIVGYGLDLDGRYRGLPYLARFAR